MTQTARQTAVAKQDQQIAANVAKIEAAKRPNALEVMASRLNISANSLKETLMATVFKDANHEQFAALVIVANEYGLNPLTKEIYAFPAKGGITPMVSIDGWVKIMNSHPQFDGIEFFDLPDDEGKLYAIEAVIYRKDRSRPIRVTEYLTECKRNTDPWNKSPARMLRHRALIQCARYAFGFSGIYTDDETSAEYSIVGNLASETPPSRSEKRLAPPAKRTDEDEETARKLDADFDPQTGEIRTESASNEQSGETVSLESALAEINAAGLVMDVNNRLSALLPLLNDDAGQVLRDAAYARIDVLKGVA